MKKHSQRAQRVADQIQRELADLLRNEVKDPRVGLRDGHRGRGDRATWRTRRCCFTHLAGSEHAAETVAALDAHRRLPAQRARRTGSTLYTVPQLHFVYDDSIESRHAPVAADRRRRRRRPSKLALTCSARSPATAARARRRRAAARQAGRLVVERRAAARAARYSAPRRPATPVRSTRSPPDCCRCASARRPSSRAFCSTPTSATRRPCDFGTTTTTGDAEGEVVATRR